MSLLLTIGSCGLYIILTILTGIISGLELAAGFDLFKTLKSKVLDFFNKKNSNYIENLENEVIASDFLRA